MATRAIDLGAVSAYAVAVQNGFEGTEAEWEQYIANASTSAASATAASEAAAAAQAAAEACEARIAPAVEAGVQAVQDQQTASVTAVQTEGGTQVQAVRDAGAEQDAGLVAEGQNQIQAIQLAAEDQEETSIAAVQAQETASVAVVNQAGATQVSAVETKGAETIASIPDDYTALSDQVTGHENLLGEHKTFITGKYYNTLPATLDFSSNPKSNQNLKCALIECEAGDIFFVRGESTGTQRMFAFCEGTTGSPKYLYKAPQGFTTNGKFTKIVAPPGSKCLVVNFGIDKTNNKLFIAKGTIPEMNSDRTSPLYCKKIIALGDSYVANNGQPIADTWLQKLANKYNMIYTPYGINGNPMCMPKVVAGSEPMIWRYTAMTDDADYIIVIGGTNDFNQQNNTYDEGGVTKTYNLDVFKEGLVTLIDGLRTKYPTQKIAFFTIWNKGPEPEYNTKAKQKAFNDAIVEACNTYGIPVFDSWTRSGMTPYWQAFRNAYYQETVEEGVTLADTTDTSHLNAAGHDRFLPVAEAFLNSI